MRRDDYEHNQQDTKAKYSRTTGYGTDSGAASSSDGPRQGRQYETRASDVQEGDDDREAWGNQSWRGSWWSSSTSRPMHDHDRRHFDTPQHRDPEQLTSQDTSWSNTQGNWRERLPQNWGPNSSAMEYAHWRLGQYPMVISSNASGTPRQPCQ